MAKNNQVNKDARESRQRGDEIILVYLWQYDYILAGLSKRHDMSVSD